jgi:predicted nucleic acid-binding protein
MASELPRETRIPQHGAVSRPPPTRRGEPRRAALDLAIAATANAHNVWLVTRDAADLQVTDTLVARTP